MTTTITVTITESNVLAALRAFLLGILPAGTGVIKGQVNRVPMPKGNFVVLTPISRTRLATNVDSFSDPFPNPGSSQSVKQSTQMSVQMDVYGSAAPDNAQIILQLMRDEIACDAFAGSSFEIQPLYATDPKQMPLINGEDQWENRWTLDAELQFNPTITIDQQFADVLEIGLVNVEATYPAT